jgi:hypothetical protein
VEVHRFGVWGLVQGIASFEADLVIVCENVLDRR